jgi:hypothetical protein
MATTNTFLRTHHTTSKGKKKGSLDFIYLEISNLCNKLKDTIHNIQQILLLSHVLYNDVGFYTDETKPPNIAGSIPYKIYTDYTSQKGHLKLLLEKMAKKYKEINPRLKEDSVLKYLIILSDIIQNKYLIDLKNLHLSSAGLDFLYKLYYIYESKDVEYPHERNDDTIAPIKDYFEKMKKDKISSLTRKEIAEYTRKQNHTIFDYVVIDYKKRYIQIMMDNMEKLFVKYDASIKAFDNDNMIDLYNEIKTYVELEPATLNNIGNIVEGAQPQNNRDNQPFSSAFAKFRSSSSRRVRKSKPKGKSSRRNTEPEVLSLG